MIAVDSNILVHAHRGDSTWHEQAVSCMKRLAEGSEMWMIPWPCVHEFLAIVTHPKIFVPPTPPEAAIRQVEFWRESPSLVLDGESSNHWATLVSLVRRSKIVGPPIHDARIAAICIDHQVEVLWTADRDHSRFSPLKVANPLIA